MKTIKIINAKEKVYYEKLKNGLDVYIWSSEYNEDTHMSLTIKYGSIHTNFKINNRVVNVPNGIAHFLEHVKFNESEDKTAHEFFGEMGSYVNAYTTYDHTSYEVICTNNIQENLKHLLFFVYNPFFTKKLVEKEKPIIIEEAKMVLDNPYNIGYKKLMECLYINNHKKYLVTGEVKDIKKISLENVLDVFNTFYTPENSFLTITGKANPQAIVDTLNTFFNMQKCKSKNYQLIEKKEPNGIACDKALITGNVQNSKLFLGFKINKDNFIYDDIKLRILFNIILNINFGMTSDFNEQLTKLELINELFYSVSVEKQQVIINFEVATDYPQKVSILIQEKMQKLEAPNNDFNRKNKSFIATSILGYDDPYEVNSEIRYDVISYGRIINNMNVILRKIKARHARKVIKKLIDYKVVEVILNPEA